MQARIAGLSLVELMVALGIISVLAMPRYHAFMVKARHGEAKSNLSHIASLQSAYKIDYFTYYQGAAMT